MRKLIGIAVVLALLSFVGSAYGAVGYEKEGERKGTATDLNVQGNCTFDNSVLTIIANGHRDGVTANVSGESNLLAAALAYGTISIADTGALDGSGARYIALANGSKGQIVTIQLVAATGGTLYITDDKVSSGVFTMTKTGWDDIALNAALDQVTLLYVDDTYGWIIIGQYAIAVT